MVELEREIAVAINEYLENNKGLFNSHYVKARLIAEHSEFGSELNWITSYGGKYEELGLIRTSVLMQALTEGYVIKEKPEEKIKNYFDRVDNEYDGCAGVNEMLALSAELRGIRNVLDILGINIEGVNKEKEQE